MSDLCSVESIKALLTCVILPWRIGKQFFERQTALRAKFFLFFLLQPSYLRLGDGCCRYRMAALSCLPSILTFTGNNRRHLAARSLDQIAEALLIALQQLPPAFPTSLHQLCSGGLVQQSVIAQGMQELRSSKLGRFLCLEQSCTGTWNHLVISASVG